MARDPTYEELVRVLKFDKSAVALDAWRTGSRRRNLEIRSALLHQGVVLRGVALYLHCIQDLPDEQVSLGLTVETSIGPRCFARVDWRAMSIHPNASGLCGDLQFIDAGRTHFHNPELCTTTENVMDHIRENLPIAASIERPPKNFEALLQRCVSILRVTNLTEAPTPPWQLRNPQP